jgi:ABC-type Na+ efflux pump permease subunit
MFIIIYGNGDGCDRRKTNRIIEIIISSVKPFQLMIGKIIGTYCRYSFLWALIVVFLYCLPASVFFWSRWWGAARICRYRPNVYQGMEFTNSEYTNKFYSLFHRWIFSLALLCAAIGALLIIDSQQFLTHYYAF